MYRILVDGNLFVSSEIEELAIINPQINQEMNKAGTFVFTLPPTHPGYDTIQKRLSIIDVYRDDDSESLFEGVCVEITVDFFKQKKFTCEGELTFLNDSNLRPHKYEGLTSRQLLEAYITEHNSLVEASKRFTVGQVTVHDSNDAIYCYTNYNSTMTEIKEDLVDDLGGFLRCRHEEGVRYLDYLAESPRTNNQVIRLGENLLDLSQNIDTESIATAIIPLGHTLDTQSIEGLDERLTIKTAAVDSMHPSGKDYVFSEDAVDNFGWIEKVVTWDDVTTVAALLSKGEAYLTDIQFENLVITAKAVDLGLTTDEFYQFRLLDSIRVVSAPHGLDRYFTLSKITINLNNPESDTITLGIEEAKTLSAKTQAESDKIKREIEQLPTSNMVQSAIDNATALITGAEGGYVVIEKNAQGQPVEIKIQDALQNPTKIWRWNQNGFGYSSDGGQTYGTAITMDGAIVADYITAGTMSAARIRGGELLVGGSGVAANGSIVVKDSNNNTIATIDNGGVDLKKGSIKGPSIEVGGSNNQNGTLVVKDANGNAIVTLDRAGIDVKDGNIEGSYIKLGGTTNGWIDVRNSSDQRTAQFTGAALTFIDPSTGNNAAQLSPTSILFNDSNGDVWTQITNSAFSLFNGRTSGTNTTFHATKDYITLNAEEVYVGTNSGQLWYTEKATHTITLPAYFNQDGTIGGGYTGVVFVNGMLPRLP